MKQKKRKIVAAISAAALTAGIVLSGTFAWQSINQTAKNEVSGKGLNPGGRLHDDFDGELKNVYVENFGEEDIFARIRLDEYMELGTGAGTPAGDRTQMTVIGKAGGTEPKYDDPATWITHKPKVTIEDCDIAEPGFHDYFQLTYGGKTVYMPTFDKNKDSLDADINGTLTGTGAGIPYDDYIKYEKDQKEWGNAEYDNDDNTVKDANITVKKEEHTAKDTLEATVITMQKWIADGKQPGNYWVYDEDGWAYWAQPIKPDTATGLFLNSIKQVAEPDKDWYYSINVVAQFATAGDWGDKAKGTGFYDATKGVAPSANGEMLLNQIAGLIDVKITFTENVTSLDPANTYHFTAKALSKGTTEEVTGKTFKWSVFGNKQGEAIQSTIDPATGELTVNETDDLKYLVIKATVDGMDKCYGTYKVQVVKPDPGVGP